MIRKHKEQDLEQILDIWNQASAIAHPFLNDAFVEKVAEDMRNMYIPNSETWVFQEGNIIVGFVSMLENEIAGLFVLPNNQSKGIGTQLVNFVSKKHSSLEVEVFEKNSIGRAFYHKCGFKQLKQYAHKESRFNVLRLSINC